MERENLGEVGAPGARDRARASYIVTDLTVDDYHEYYNGFANRTLWPIFNYRLDIAEFSRRDLRGYLRVNERFAAELHKILTPDDIVWIYDYHLLPLAKMLRDFGHQNRIGYFHHIPFAPAEILTALPSHEHLIPMMCHYDLIGFQTDCDAMNFANYLKNECKIPSSEGYTFQAADRTVRIGVSRLVWKRRSLISWRGRRSICPSCETLWRAWPAAT